MSAVSPPPDLPNLIINVPTNAGDNSVEDVDDDEHQHVDIHYFDPIDDVDFFKSDPDAEDKKPVSVSVYLGDDVPSGLSFSSSNDKVTSGLHADNVDDENLQRSRTHIRRYVNPDALPRFDDVQDSTPEQQNRLERRQKRFFEQLLDSRKSESVFVSDRKLNKLYKEFGIDPSQADDVTRPQRPRLNVLHVRGVNQMNTKDCFEYFGSFSPPELEWINDNSCNIIFLDAKTAAKALLTLGKPIKRTGGGTEMVADAHKVDEEDVSPLKRVTPTPVKLESMPPPAEDDSDVSIIGSRLSQSDTDANTATQAHAAIKQERFDDYETLVDSSDEEDLSEGGDRLQQKLTAVDCTMHFVPPGPWRVGVSTPKCSLLLMRYAMTQDVKTRGAALRSAFYRDYGNPNYNGVRGLISRTRRRQMDNQRFGDLRSHLGKRRRKEDETGFNEDDYYRLSADEQWKERLQHDDRSERTYLDGSNQVRLKYEEPEEGEVDDDGVELRVSASPSPSPSEASSSEDDDDDDASETPQSVASGPKRFKMRMRADDEEKRDKKRQKNRMIDLFETGLRSRLGRRQNDNEHDDRGASSDDED